MQLGERQPLPTNHMASARFVQERLAALSWGGLIAIVCLALPLRMHATHSLAFWWSIGWLILVGGGGAFGLRLVKDRSRWAAPWQVVVVTGALFAANASAPSTSLIWPLFPMSAIITLLFFPTQVARLHTILLAGALLGSTVVASGTLALLAAGTVAAFTLILIFVVERTRQRESQLVQEIAARATQTDAFTAISWSLTSLAPTTTDFHTILQNACPPDVSLALMLLREGQLVPETAVGPDAAAMLRWRYPLRAESTSMVAQALRERRTLVASIGGENAALLLIGALPPTPLPLRAAAALPIMRQGAAPIGVLLAIASQADALGDVQRLGILPAVANQFAVALDNARLFHDAQERADHDALTGLYHHRAIHARLHEEIQRASRSARPFALLLLDLDDFRRYNETYGHQVGDAILVQTARTLEGALRAGSILGRLGGDEFLAILPDTDPGEATHIARTILAAFAAASFHPHAGAERLPITISAGLALYPNDGRTAQELVAATESAKREANHNGGNRLEMTQPDGTKGMGRAIDLRSFGVLEALVTAVDHKDRYTRDHSEEVATYAQILGETIGLEADRLSLLFDAGLLHDVGKVGVPDAVLRKPGKLTDAEFDAMKQHVVLSEALLRCLLPADTDPDVLEAVRHHHERWDGRGYPRGLAGTDVPLIGRIMIVADATSAMHMDRPYRKGLTPEQIIDELRRGAGSQFDPDLVEPFIRAFIAHHHLSEAEMMTEAQPDKAPQPRAA